MVRFRVVWIGALFGGSDGRTRTGPSGPGMPCQSGSADREITRTEGPGHLRQQSRAPPTRPGKTPAPASERPVLLPDAAGAQPVPVYKRDQLAPGAALAGPALVEEPSSTTLVLADMNVTIDAYENMIITLQPSGQTP